MPWPKFSMASTLNSVTLLLFALMPLPPLWLDCERSIVPMAEPVSMPLPEL